ncbi:hypothetical protein Syun_028198 [Stephania yunnanensis]|uniref:Uncharacterized protein n=1 Tax=Stephania yunnanensis TaxID=152371 RepID=A0AAP0EM54_9MAGN
MEPKRDDFGSEIEDVAVQSKKNKRTGNALVGLATKDGTGVYAETRVSNPLIVLPMGTAPNGVPKVGVAVRESGGEWSIAVGDARGVVVC